jgi:Icc-related predicted phosphoesterase
VKLLIFSDIHNDWKTLERILAVEADFYISAGDQVSWGRGLDQAGEILRTRGDKVWVLPGNHETASQIAALCEMYGLNNFHERTFAVGEWKVAGLGYSSITPFDTPGEYTEEQIEAKLAPFAKLDRLVLVCHAPPWGTDLDQIRDGLHGGSKAVREFIEKHQPVHFFCGHIHEGAGKEVAIGRTRARNVGKKAFLLDLAE